MHRYLLPALIVCLFVVIPASQAGNASRTTARASKNANGNPMSVTPEREAAAMTFVKQHHPELSDLLAYLKKNMPKQYDKAARELFRASERLARLKDNGDDERYDLELKLWQTRSRVQLLTARLRTRPDDKLKAELRELLVQQYDLRLSQLEIDRDRAARRLAKVDEQIEQYKNARQQVIDRQMRVLAERKGKSTKPSPAVTQRPHKTTSKVLKKSDQ